MAEFQLSNHHTLAHHVPSQVLHLPIHPLWYHSPAEMVWVSYSAHHHFPNMSSLGKEKILEFVPIMQRWITGQKNVFDMEKINGFLHWGCSHAFHFCQRVKNKLAPPLWGQVQSNFYFTLCRASQPATSLQNSSQCKMVSSSSKGKQ